MRTKDFGRGSKKMKVTILVDNTTYRTNLLAEDGFSAYIEDGDFKVLLDTGESELFLRNAAHLKLDILQANYIVLSHGHHDHTWGLKYFIAQKQAQLDAPLTKLLMHPRALYRKTADIREIGFDLHGSELDILQPKLSTKPVWLNERLLYLGQIERVIEHEGQNPLGEEYLPDGTKQADYLHDDTALAYKGEQGLVIITGCSHSGIGNIIAQAKRLCQEDRIQAVIGGLHLRNPEPEVLKATVAHLATQNIKELLACHCTDQNSRIALAQLGNLISPTVGLVLEYK